MNSAWLSENQLVLSADIAALQARLDSLVQQEDVLAAPFIAQAQTLHTLCDAFGLSAFEGALLLLCAAVELDSRVAAACAQLHQQEGPGDTKLAYANFALASRLLGDAHWSALLPTAPLRYWRLVEFETRREGSLAQARLKVNERVLHHLTGLSYLDESLHALLQVCREPQSLLPPQGKAAAFIAGQLSAQTSSAFLLMGCDARTRRDVVAHACVELGLRLFALRAEDVPADTGDRDKLARVWMREALLAPALLLIEGCANTSVMALAERIGTAIAFSSNDGAANTTSDYKQFVPVQVAAPTSIERRTWWRDALGEQASNMNGSLDALATQFELNPQQIASVINSAESATPQALWQASRAQSRPRLDELAQRIEPSATWADLVLPPAQTSLLKQIGAHVRQRLKVYEDWGFGAASRGLGISALFAGFSGTGKTMASEVLAHELQLDLYRIDLSQVVSKYIGETEKNLRRVFDAADGGGVILLFDEADALFGKRSEVKDSHDRYANIEVSYLLQRMETYRGLAILTTNQRAALDTAFLRRLRFVVEFPFPDAAHRAEIWRRAFPAATPTEGLEARKLARLNVTGGNIRNIAMNAAFLAADADEPVRMVHVLRAARTEYAKLDKAVSDAEVRDWI